MEEQAGDITPLLLLSFAVREGERRRVHNSLCMPTSSLLAEKGREDLHTTLFTVHCGGEKETTHSW